MEKTSLNLLLKFVILALLVGEMVPIFGEARVVIEEVVVMEKSNSKMVDGKVVAPKVVMSSEQEGPTCRIGGQSCNPQILLDCCQGLFCFPDRLWPPITGPGVCVQLPAGILLKS